MTLLPQPADLTSLVLRVDFSHDAAWDALKTAIEGFDATSDATFASDPAYAGVRLQELVDADAVADDEDKLIYLFLADATTMADENARSSPSTCTTSPAARSGCRPAGMPMSPRT